MPSRLQAYLRHARYYLSVSQTVDTLYLRGGDGLDAALKMFDAEWPHIHTAQEWAAAHSSRDPEAARICADYPLAVRYCLPLRQTSRYQVRWWEAALKAARRIGDRRTEESVLRNLGLVYEDLGDTRRAIRCHLRDLEMARESGDRHGESRALNNLGSAYVARGEPRAAYDLFEQSWSIKRSRGDDARGEAVSRMNMGDALVRAYTKRGRGEPRELDKGISFLLEARSGFRDLRDVRNEAMCLTNLAEAYLSLENPNTARRYCNRALVKYRKIGSHGEVAYVLFVMALVWDALGKRDRAIECMENALTVFEKIGSPYAKRARKQLERLRRVRLPARLKGKPVTDPARVVKPA